MCGGVCARAHMSYIHLCHGAHLEIRGQFVGVGSLLPHRCRGWVPEKQQVHLSSEPAHQNLIIHILRLEEERWKWNNYFRKTYFFQAFSKALFPTPHTIHLGKRNFFWALLSEFSRLVASFPKLTLRKQNYWILTRKAYSAFFSLPKQLKFGIAN